MSRVAPYTRLKQEAAQWVHDKVLHPREKGMFTFPNPRTESFRLDDVYQRVAAADQLGYVVELRVVGDDLQAVYVEKRPTSLPWCLR